jgi:hypothetical protein
MDVNEFLLRMFDQESARSRLVLERVPCGHDDWKPHDKSMAFGYLANLIATMPSWIMMQLMREELDAVVAGTRQVRRSCARRQGR